MGKKSGEFDILGIVYECVYFLNPSPWRFRSGAGLYGDEQNGSHVHTSWKKQGKEKFLKSPIV